jgi:hypothetical protein
VTIRRVLPIAVLAVIAGLLLAPGLVSGPSLDAAVFTYVADRFADGARLYVDVWDHKPPGVYYLYGLAQAVLFWVEPWHVTWVISWLATALTGATARATMRRLDVRPGPAMLAAAGIVMAMAQYLTALGGGLTEPVATLAAAVAMLLALDRAPSLRRSALIGLLLGVSLMTSLILVAGVLAIGSLVLARSGTGRDRAARAVAGIAGALLPVLAVGVHLVLLGVLDDALGAVVGYTAAYRASGAALGAELSAPVAAWLVLSYLFLVIPAAMGLMSVLRPGATHRVEAVACVAWIALSLVTFFGQGRFFAHYAIPLAVPLGLLAALGLERTAVLRARRSGELARFPLYVPLVTALAVSAYAGAAGGFMEWQPVQRGHERSQAVSAEIKRLTAGDETIFVWGNEPQVYLDANRESAGPYAFMYPLVTPGYVTQARVAALLDALEAAPPAVIVDAGSPSPGAGGFLPLLIDRPIGTDGRTEDLLDPVRDSARDRYVEQAVVDGWVLYVVTER